MIDFPQFRKDSEFLDLFRRVETLEVENHISYMLNSLNI